MFTVVLYYTSGSRWPTITTIINFLPLFRSFRKHRPCSPDMATSVTTGVWSPSRVKAPSSLTLFRALHPTNQRSTLTCCHGCHNHSYVI